MFTRLSLVLATALLVAAPALGETAKFNKIPSKGTTFEKKSGYWVECRDTGLGQVCETVYAKVKDGRLKPVPVAAAKLTKKQGQTMVCYWGSNNTEICYWAYSPRK